MLETIINALHKNNIETYNIQKIVKESAELFFIKKDLDLRRMKKVTSYEVTVYRDFYKEDCLMRGSSDFYCYPNMTEKEITEKAGSAFFAASFICNPYYELIDGKKEEFIKDVSSLAVHTLEDSAKLLTDAIFAGDCSSKAFLNSCELFVTKETRHMITSQGTDVSYEKYEAKGELIGQCKTPHDVELYDEFSYDSLETDALKKKVTELLARCEIRAEAEKPPVTGTYDVILTQDSIRTLLDFYITRSSASFIYSKYSDYKINECVQGKEVRGELLNITLKTDRPYSAEGIRYQDRPLLGDGKLKTIHGGCQFCSYLSLEPTGSYKRIKVDNGSVSLDEMKRKPYLEILSFSSFEADAMSGACGGEIRLANYYDGKKISVLTGGSIQFSILDAQKDFVFSKERYVSSNYDGPAAVQISHVRTAGGENDA